MKKKLLALITCFITFMFTSCLEESVKFKPYLHLYNASPYTICMDIGYTQFTNDYTPPNGNEIWLEPKQSYKFYVNKDKHYGDIVKIAFYVDYYGDGNARYATTWHKGRVKDYPNDGYIYSKITVPSYGNVETTFETNYRAIENADNALNQELNSGLSPYEDEVKVLHK